MDRCQFITQSFITIDNLIDFKMAVCKTLIHQRADFDQYKTADGAVTQLVLTINRTSPNSDACRNYALFKAYCNQRPFPYRERMCHANKLLRVTCRLEQ